MTKKTIYYILSACFFFAPLILLFFIGRVFAPQGGWGLAGLAWLFIIGPVFFACLIASITFLLIALLQKSKQSQKDLLSIDVGKGKRISSFYLIFLGIIIIPLAFVVALLGIFPSTNNLVGVGGMFLLLSFIMAPIFLVWGILDWFSSRRSERQSNTPA